MPQTPQSDGFVETALQGPDSLSEMDYGAPYGHLQTTVTFITRGGKVQLPIADAGQSCAIVDLSAPTQVKMVSWVVTRKGLLPIAPSPATVDSEHVLIDSEIGAHFPMLLVGGGGHLWGLSGVYTYALKTAIKPEETGLPLGKYPIDATPANTLNIPADVFSDQLLSRGN